MKKTIRWGERARNEVKRIIDCAAVIKSPVGRTVNRRKYYDLICAFDIETSTLNLPNGPEAVMYVWQWHFENQITVIGRSWKEFIVFINYLNSQIEDSLNLCVYVHNLSYEFQFIRSIIELKDIFCVARRKILSARYDNIEFRCSYLLSNTALSQWCRNMGVKHQKLSGEEFDYREERFEDTPLTVKQIQYSIVDVIAVTECVRELLRRTGFTIQTIPKTSTGFVRKDLKTACAPIYMGVLQDCKESPDLYRILREAFRGGNTHANRYYAGDILEGVKSTDKTSSYPASLCLYDYPVGGFKKTIFPSCSLMWKYLTMNIPFVIRAKFTKIQLKNILWGFPYIPLAKCTKVSGQDMDNGRILRADMIQISLTDIDFLILYNEYTWDTMEIDECWISKYESLPKEVLGVVIKYFRDKTLLKGEDPVEYGLKKSLLNSIYGMMAEKADRKDMVFRDGEYIQKECDLEKNLRKKLLPYSWGVLTTALARRELERGLEAAGIYGVYCDTDSVKYVGNVDFGPYNSKIKKLNKSRGCIAKDKRGKHNYLGVFEDEGTYDRFITWGAKKYAYEDAEGLHITIAGVSKADGAKELEQLGGLEALIPNETVFKIGGGVRAIYNDHPVAGVVYNSHILTVTSNTALLPDTYTLSLSDDYESLLDYINESVVFWR